MALGWLLGGKEWWRCACTFQTDQCFYPALKGLQISSLKLEKTWSHVLNSKNMPESCHCPDQPNQWWNLPPLLPCSSRSQCERSFWLCFWRLSWQIEVTSAPLFLEVEGLRSQNQLLFLCLRYLAIRRISFHHPWWKKMENFPMHIHFDFPFPSIQVVAELVSLVVWNQAPFH